MITQTTTPVAFAAYIGLDWADQKHDLSLQAADQAQPETLQLDQRPETLHAWVAQLCARFAGRPVALALEQKRGALIYALLPYEFIVLYPINPKALARYREAFTTSGAKDDPVDARLLRELGSSSFVNHDLSTCDLLDDRLRHQPDCREPDALAIHFGQQGFSFRIYKRHR